MLSDVKEAQQLNYLSIITFILECCEVYKRAIKVYYTVARYTFRDLLSFKKVI